MSIPLSPGNLLLALHRNQLDQSLPIVTARNEIEDFLKIHQIAWQKKISEEILIRFNQWKNIIEEYRDEGIIDDTYTYNVRVRVIIQILMKELTFVDPRLIGGMENLDRTLEQMTSPGKFRWDELLQELFPQNEYGFLYLDPLTR